MLLTQLKLEDAYNQRINKLRSGMDSYPGETEARIAELLGTKACQIDDAVIEPTLSVLCAIDSHIIAKLEASFPADSEQGQKVRESSLDPLKAFADSFTSTPAQWLTHVEDGHQVDGDMAVALQKSLSLALANDKLRNTVLAELNQTLEVAVGEGDDKIIISSATSVHTSVVLKALSKRDLTDKLKKLANFVSNHLEGFSIY